MTRIMDVRGDLVTKAIALQLKKVSYRKQIGSAVAVVGPVKIFITSGLIITQKLVAVTHSVRARRRSQKVGMGLAPLDEWHG